MEVPWHGRLVSRPEPRPSACMAYGHAQVSALLACVEQARAAHLPGSLSAGLRGVGEGDGKRRAMLKAVCVHWHFITL